MLFLINFYYNKAYFLCLYILFFRKLRKLFINNGITELLFTSDSPTAHGSIGTIPNLFLQTANFASNPEIEFLALKLLQPNKPIMAMEFWAGKYTDKRKCFFVC